MRRSTIALISAAAPEPSQSKRPINASNVCTLDVYLNNRADIIRICSRSKNSAMTSSTAAPRAQTAYVIAPPTYRVTRVKSSLRPTNESLEFEPFANKNGIAIR